MIDISILFFPSLLREGGREGGREGEEGGERAGEEGGEGREGRVGRGEREGSFHFQTCHTLSHIPIILSVM